MFDFDRIETVARTIYSCRWRIPPPSFLWLARFPIHCGSRYTARQEHRKEAPRPLRIMSKPSLFPACRQNSQVQESRFAERSFKVILIGSVCDFIALDCLQFGNRIGDATPRLQDICNLQASLHACHSPALIYADQSRYAPEESSKTPKSTLVNLRLAANRSGFELTTRYRLEIAL